MSRTYTVKVPAGSVLGICEAHGGGQLVLLQLPASSGNAQLVLRKIDQHGAKIWQKGLQLALQPGQTIVSGSIARLPDKKYAMTAIRNTPTTGGSEPEAFLIQLTKDGSIEWQKRFAGNHGALVPLDDGGFVAAGSNNNSAASGVTVAAMQAGGTVRWARMYSGDFSFSPTVQGPQTMLVTSSGELIFASGMDSPKGTLVFKTDLAGNLIWSKRIHGAGLRFVSATAMGDSGMVLLFDQYSSGSIFLIGLNASGDQVWRRSFKFSNSRTRGLAVADNAGGLVVAGKSGSEGFTATVDSERMLETSSNIAAPISAPAFMLYDHGNPGGWVLAANDAQGGSMVFGLDPNLEGCSMFRSTPAKMRTPEAVYVVDFGLTSSKWNPRRGTSALHNFMPSIADDETVCRNEGSPYPSLPGNASNSWD